jgi:pSer/pThr/pTyr-binding forkhead associated (FHA) protein
LRTVPQERKIAQGNVAKNLDNMQSERPRFALRFISGKYQGGEFPLRMNREIIIGRSSDLDMVLVEDMVSRKHAKISTTDGEVYIQDLGSTNGTFVNGEKVSRSRLQEGDRILVGTSIIKMVSVDPASYSEQSEAEARRRLEAGASRQQTSGRPMSGVIEEIPLPDLLQLLSTSRKSGVLTVSTTNAVGRLYLRQGQIYFAAINDDFGVSPHKAIYRMLTWTNGTFELEPGGEIRVMEELKESTEALLMEGMRQLDEVKNLESKLPSFESALAVPTPLAGKLRELSPQELDIFQLVLDHGQVQAVLDNYTGTDLEAAELLVALMKREFVVVP